MKLKYAVGYVNFFDNELILEVVSANSLREAILSHSKLRVEDDPHTDHWLDSAPDEIEEIKEYFFDADILVSAIVL